MFETMYIVNTMNNIHVCKCVTTNDYLGYSLALKQNLLQFEYL